MESGNICFVSGIPVSGGRGRYNSEVDFIREGKGNMAMLPIFVPS